MKKRWYVIDSQENLPSFDADKDRQEDFPTYAAALKRARSLADDEPHKGFLICEATHLVVVETKPVVVTPINK